MRFGAKVGLANGDARLWMNDELLNDFISVKKQSADTISKYNNR